MISTDGTGKTGNVIRIPIGNDDFAMQIIPNPSVSGNQVEVRFNVPAGLVSLELYDVMGQRLMNQNVEVLNGENTASISTKGLNKGIYLVTLRYQDLFGQLKKVTKRLAILN